MTDKKVKVDYMARVEGEAALDITVSKGKIEDLKLNIFEPARFFQSFLVGRKYDEVPDIVARICGICPASHMLCAIHAIERAFDITPSEETIRLRKLLSKSQWLQSHTLNVYMLALPDYLGYNSVMEMVPEHKDVVTKALSLKRLGNDITAAVGGREVHPINTVVGGFTDAPSKETVDALVKRLKDARQDALKLAEVAAGLELPELNRSMEFVAISQEDEYASIDGKIVSTEGLSAFQSEYRDNIIENHIPHSNALHSSIIGRNSFAVGPLARVNLNYENLSDKAKEMAKKNKLKFPSYNPFSSVHARVVEIIHSIEELITILNELECRADIVDYNVTASEGTGITEAPRGMNYHYYSINDDGIIEDADVVSPTAHNSFSMEEDLRELVPNLLDLSDEELTLKCEMLIRAYDPCFSCSVHFLNVNIKRDE